MRKILKISGYDERKRTEMTGKWALGQSFCLFSCALDQFLFQINFILVRGLLHVGGVQPFTNLVGTFALSMQPRKQFIDCLINAAQ